MPRDWTLTDGRCHIDTLTVRHRPTSPAPPLTYCPYWMPLSDSPAQHPQQLPVPSCLSSPACLSSAALPQLPHLLPTLLTQCSLCPHGQTCSNSDKIHFFHLHCRGGFCANVAALSPKNFSIVGAVALAIARRQCCVLCGWDPQTTFSDPLAHSPRLVRHIVLWVLPHVHTFSSLAHRSENLHLATLCCQPLFLTHALVPPNSKVGITCYFMCVRPLGCFSDDGVLIGAG